MKTARHHLTAEQAAETLGITPATLYAYVSRGQLRSEPIPGRLKTRRYYREDLERLLERKEARRDPAKAAARGLHWGGPVLESGITLIDNGRFYYRGHDAVALAETATLEQAAGLLWAADETERGQLFEQPCALPLVNWRSFGPAPGIRSLCFRPRCRSPRASIWRPTICARPGSGRPGLASSGY